MSFLDLHPAYAHEKRMVLGYVLICALAYQVRAVMGLKLRRAGIEMSVEEALEVLDTHRVVELGVDAPGVQVVRRVTEIKGKVQALVDLF